MGDTIINYQPAGSTAWNPVETATGAGVASVTYSGSTNTGGTQYAARYVITNGLSGAFVYDSVFNFEQSNVVWTLNLTNLASKSMTIGDLALQMPMNTASPQDLSGVFKHSVISGNGSFIYWMRNNSVGPYLLMTPDSRTSFEYWDTLGNSGGITANEVYMSIPPWPARGRETEFGTTITNSGAHWRLPNTSMTLAPGASTNYALTFQWVNDYNGVRQALTNAGKVDVHVVPGMTVPTNLFAEFSLDTTQQINSITPEFPGATQLQSLGANGVYQLYKVQFSQLGENMLTINYGNNQTMYLEFFVTEPIETLFQKRAGFLVSHQQWTGITTGH